MRLRIRYRSAEDVVTEREVSVVAVEPPNAIHAFCHLRFNFNFNLLLEHYRRDITLLINQAFAASDPRVAKLRELQNREQRLLSALDALYPALAKPES